VKIQVKKAAGFHSGILKEKSSFIILQSYFQIRQAKPKFSETIIELFREAAINTGCSSKQRSLANIVQTIKSNQRRLDNVCHLRLWGK